jgi:phenylacetate-CoA ligase
MLAGALTAARLIHRARQSSRWPRQKLREHQERQLAELLRHAYQNVPLYRRLYDDAGFQPGDFRSLADVGRIPILRKPILKAAGPDEVVARGTDIGRCSVVCTSGSTGVPLKIYLGQFESQWQRAVAWRILFEHGFRWTDRTLEIRMTAGPAHGLQKLGIARKDWLSILDSPQSWARCLAAGQHEIVVASATTLGALAEAVEAGGLRVKPPRIIVSDSETLPPRTRALVQRVLGRDPVDVFGLVELSNFAWECEEHNGFHISADSHLVEVLADAGEAGPLIVTDLAMRTMPMVRYETGDMAELPREDRPCPCGRTLPMLARVHGRAVDSVLLGDGRRLFWPFFHEILGARDELRQWRVTQTSLGRVQLQLCMDPAHRPHGEQIAADVRARLPGELELIVENVDRFPDAPNQKTRQVISLLGKTPSC